MENMWQTFSSGQFVLENIYVDVSCMCAQVVLLLTMDFFAWNLAVCCIATCKWYSINDAFVATSMNCKLL